MLATLMLAAAAAGCHPIEADKIFGRDLAAVSDVFASVAPATVVAYASTPGRTRVIRPEELARLPGVATPAAELQAICFEWKMETLTVERVTAAMQRALGSQKAEVDVLGVSRDPVPAGEVIFPLAGLPVPGAASGVIWRGHVRYGQNRRTDVWARVKLTISYDRVVAAVPIKAGELIRPEQVRIEHTEGTSPGTAYASKIEQVARHVARQSFAEGAPIVKALLGAARDVAKGDTVKVEVRSGAARLSMVAQAESAGAIGDVIAIRNVSSGKNFRARIEGPGRVVVEAVNGGSE